MVKSKCDSIQSAPCHIFFAPCVGWPCHYLFAMGQLQDLLQTQAEEVPRLLIVNMVREKLASLGIADEALETRLVEHILTNDGREFNANDADPEIILTFDDSDLQSIERQGRKIGKKLAEKAKSMCVSLSFAALDQLRRKWEQARCDGSLPDSRIGMEIEARWGIHLADLGLLIDLCQDAGSEFHRSYLKEKSGRYNGKSDALAKLHIRGCRIAQEILVLMT
jgi:hypothetical protein